MDGRSNRGVQNGTRAELAEAHTPVLLVGDNQNLSWSEEDLVLDWSEEEPKLANGNIRPLKNPAASCLEGAASLCNFV